MRPRLPQYNDQLLRTLLLALGVYALCRWIGLGPYGALAAAILWPFALMALVVLLAGFLGWLEGSWLVRALDRQILRYETKQRVKRAAEARRRREQLVAKRNSERG